MIETSMPVEEKKRVGKAKKRREIRSKGSPKKGGPRPRGRKADGDGKKVAVWRRFAILPLCGKTTNPMSSDIDRVIRVTGLIRL